MNTQERQLIDELFDRLAKLETAPRDQEAEAAIMQGLRRAPNATYALVQTALVQDEALKRANARIEELESHADQRQSGGFLDSMRDALFGSSQQQQRGSVPNVRSQEPSRPVWNSGQVNAQLDPRYAGGSFASGPSYAAPGYGAPYGQPSAGGSFLGTAAATAAGVIGGAMLMNSIRGLMGGGAHQAFTDSSAFGDSRSPWSDQSDSSLARDAGIDDIGRHAANEGDGSRESFVDQASNNADRDSFGDDDGNIDNDDFGGGDDGGSDYA